MKLNFGCGNKILKGYINVDIQYGEGIDKSFDFDKFPYPFEDNTFDFILLDNVLEHLEDPKAIMNELHRICKKSGIVRIIVPHFNNSGAFNDYTHKHYFNLRSLENLISTRYTVNKKIGWKIIKRYLKPTFLGIIFPQKLLRKLAWVLGNLVLTINVDYKKVEVKK